MGRWPEPRTPLVLRIERPSSTTTRGTGWAVVHDVAIWQSDGNGLDAAFNRCTGRSKPSACRSHADDASVTLNAEGGQNRQVGSARSRTAPNAAAVVASPLARRSKRRETARDAVLCHKLPFVKGFL